MKIILASQSPRRRAMLASIVDTFDVDSADIDETPFENEQAADYVQRLALEKARVIGKDHPDALVIGSDTTVVVGNQILEKPLDLDDSKRMFALMSGTTHQVMTAFALVKGDKYVVENVITQVTFKTVTEQEVEEYWHTNEPQDKAGSYGLQGIGGKFVKAINGSVSSVVGLPLVELQQAITEFS